MEAYLGPGWLTCIPEVLLPQIQLFVAYRSFCTAKGLRSAIAKSKLLPCIFRNRKDTISCVFPVSSQLIFKYKQLHLHAVLLRDASRGKTLFSDLQPYSSSTTRKFETAGGLLFNDGYIT